MNAKSKKKSALLSLSVLFIVSMGILLLGVNSVIGNLSLAGGNVVFGNSVVGSLNDQNDPNAQSVTYFTCSNAGSVTDIVAYISGVSAGNAKAAIYGDDGSLVSQSGSVAIDTSFGWVNFPLPFAYLTEAGHTYGLAIMGDVSINVALVPTAGDRIGGPGFGSFSQGFTDPFGTRWFDDSTGGMSIYASGSLTVNPTPSPSNVVTPTPAPTNVLVNIGITYDHTQGSISMPLSPVAMTTFEGQENYQYYSGTAITLMALPNSGYRFDHYLITMSPSSIVTVTANPWQTNIGSSVQVDLVFAPVTSNPPVDGTTSGSMAILGGGLSAISGLMLGLIGLGKVKL